jgi:centrin-1
MVSLGFDAKNALIFKMITKMDEDGSGKIEFNEWLHLMTYKVTPASSKDAIEKIFPLYDDEGTGLLSVKNLERVCENLGLTVPEEELQEMITRADLDKDGFVNLEEFYTILTRPVKE